MSKFTAYTTVVTRRSRSPVPITRERPNATTAPTAAKATAGRMNSFGIVRMNTFHWRSTTSEAENIQTWYCFPLMCRIAFPTVDGQQVIVADFSKPGRVVIFDPKTGRKTWEYFVTEGEGALDHPSLARELPDTGDIIVADDLRDRVLVIDRKTKAIIWQYGVTGVKGHQPGYLNYPDGFDLDLYRDWKNTPKTP